MSKLTERFAALGWKLVGGSLGAGGQATAHEAVRIGKENGDRYVIKYLREKGGQKAHERFRQELEAIQKLDHPGIVKIIEYAANDDDVQYYVMPFVDTAKSLRQRMTKNSNPFFKEPLKAVNAFIEIAEALSFCARYGIIHRDLSPANILVTDAGNMMLIDFGLCHIENGNLVTVTDEAVGTPHYRAPECSGYPTEQPSVRSDLYSAGKILWSMITNKSVFDREAAVFDRLSLANELPDCKMSWHFFHIFQGTIRHESKNRFSAAEDAIKTAEKVRQLIIDGFKPLEELASLICPLCGIGSFQTHQLSVDYPDEMTTFAATMSPVRNYAVCPYCCHVSFIAHDILIKKLSRRKSLT